MNYINMVVKVENKSEHQVENVDLKRVHPIEKILICFFFVAASIPLVTIPFILFVFEKNKMSKKMRDFTNIIYLSIASTFLIIGSIISIFIFLSVYDTNITGLARVPFDLWNYLMENIPIFMFLLSSTLISAIFINRLAVNLLVHEERLINEREPRFWMKLKAIFKWKNKDNKLASGNETLMKLKNAATFVGISTLALLILTPFMEDSDMLAILDYLTDYQGTAELFYYELPTLYILIFGGMFILSNMLLWFYMGRIFNYQANFFLRMKNFKWIWMKVLSIFISLYAFLPMVFTVFERPFYGVVGSLAISIMGIVCWVVVVYQFRFNPDRLVLDPKHLKVKLEKEIISPTKKQFQNPLKETDYVKRFCFGIFIVTVLGISFLNGVFWFTAMSYYAEIVQWHEWGFYLWLGLIFTVGPVLLLFFLRSVYVRRLFIFYFFIVMFILAFEVLSNLPFNLEFGQVLYGILFSSRLGFLEYNDIFTTGTRLGHVVLFLMVTIASFISLYIIKRKAIPIGITTQKRRSWSSYRNLRSFIFSTKRQRVRKENVVMLAFLVMVMGTAITYEPPTTLVLSKDPQNDMQISFWGGSYSLSDEELTVLGNYNIRLFGWGYKRYDRLAQAQRIASYGVEVIPIIHFPDDASDLENSINDAATWIDYWNNNSLKANPFLGFTFDKEDWETVVQYNETAFDEAVQAVHDLASYINGRGYELFLTEYMVTINDLLDGDHDVAISTHNPFDPTWNLSHFDWMIYRDEDAIDYNEPNAYFTYEWARSIKHFMLEIGGPTFFEKSSMSLGVTSDTLPLYRGPNGLDEFLKDVKICQATGIREIKIFSYRGFIELWGAEGIEKMMQELQSFSKIGIPFKRKATFFGNLKMPENPTGSVFGFMYQDAWLNKWVGITPIIWLVFLLGVSVFVSFLSFKSKNKKNEKVPRYSRGFVDNLLIFSRIVLVALIIGMSAWVITTMLAPTIYNFIIAL